MVRLHGPGGHTARPHLTADLVFALGKVVTELPAALSRRVDPRAALSLVWGRVGAGRAANAIPDDRRGRGHRALPGRRRLARRARAGRSRWWPTIVAPYGVPAEVDLHPRRAAGGQRGRPACDAAGRRGAARPRARTRWSRTEQSLGGEDFAWYLAERARGAGPARRQPARGARRGPAGPAPGRLFDVDERAISVGARVLVGATYVALLSF